MATKIYDRDDSNLDGSTEWVDRETSNRSAEYLWHASHDLDTSVTVNFYGTHDNDDDRSDTVKLGDMSLSSGGDTGFETMTDPWEKVAIEFVYGSDPTNGTITLYETAVR
jgi:hypothetical protein